MQPNIHSDWKGILAEEFEKPYFKALWQSVMEEYDSHTCFPPKNEIFAAFEHCAYADTRAVIIGQDPYHGAGQANGLAFSVNEGIAHPPSLKNIFKELQRDTGKAYPTNGNLEPWAKQGVLLLNAALTVRENEAASHKGYGWERFTDAVIAKLSQRQDPLVFMLWGRFAQTKSKMIDSRFHKTLVAGHPSPLSANRGHWFGHGHFSETNRLLREQGKPTIIW